jgi:hypothetical protein
MLRDSWRKESGVPEIIHARKRKSRGLVQRPAIASSFLSCSIKISGLDNEERIEHPASHAR